MTRRPPAASRRTGVDQPESSPSAPNPGRRQRRRQRRRQTSRLCRLAAVPISNRPAARRSECPLNRPGMVPLSMRMRSALRRLGARVTSPSSNLSEACGNRTCPYEQRCRGRTDGLSIAAGTSGESLWRPSVRNRREATGDAEQRFGETARDRGTPHRRFRRPQRTIAQTLLGALRNLVHPIRPKRSWTGCFTYIRLPLSVFRTFPLAKACDRAYALAIGMLRRESASDQDRPNRSLGAVGAT